MADVYIVYDKKTNQILRHVSETPILAENEACLKSTTEMHREDSVKVRQMGKLKMFTLSTLENIDSSRQTAIEAFDKYRFGHTETKERMIPHPASPTGQLPATHYFCYAYEDATFFTNLVAFAVGHPFICEIVELDSAQACLDKYGLKEIK